MKIFDIHAHIYPDAIADRAVHAISAAYDDIEIRNDGRLDTMVRRAKAAGITRFAAHSVATVPKQVDRINRFVLEAAQKHPDMIVPFGALHPDLPDVSAAVDQLVEGGFWGVKLHPEMQNFKVDETRALDMLSAVAGRLPVLLHCGDYRCDNSAPERIKRMLKAVPGLKVVCAHLGGWTTWEEAAWQLIGQDIWVDTSSSIYALDVDTSVSIIRGYGVDRVLFGTDFPMWNPEDEVQRLLELPLSLSEVERILWGNHLKLFRSALKR